LVEIEVISILLELEDILYIQTIHNLTQMDEILLLFSFRFKVVSLDQLLNALYVLTYDLLVDFFVIGRVLVLEDLLGLAVQQFDLLLHSVVYAVIKYLKDIVLLLNIASDILVILLSGELFPIIKSFEGLLVVHLLFEPLKHRQQLSDQQITHHIGKFDLLVHLHGFLGD
jgi:hypothetical protein